MILYTRTFEKKEKNVRHVTNFFITTALVWMFDAMEWIQIKHTLGTFEQSWINELLVAGIVGLIFTIGLWLAGIVFGVVVLGSCGIGCFLYPVYLAFLGPLGFWAVTQLLPGWIVINSTTVQIIVMGLLISFVRIHDRSTSSTTTVSSTT